jgi:hypothetical protein
VELAHISNIFGRQLHLLQRINFQDVILLELVGCRYLPILARLFVVSLIKYVVMPLLFFAFRVFSSLSYPRYLHLRLIH